MTTQFRELFKNVANDTSRLTIRPSPLVVTTMTLTGHLDRKLPNIRTLCRQNEDILAEHDLAIKATKTNSEFCNSVSLVSPTRGEQNIKLFTNGSIQFTGAKSIVAFLEIMNRVCLMLSQLLEQPCTLESTSIQMINCSFKTNAIVGLQSIKAHAEARGMVASYEPDSGYPGAKIWCPEIPAADDTDTKVSKCTIMVFRSGHATLSSGNIPGIRHGCTTLVDILTQMNCTNKSNVHQKAQRKATVGWRIEHGYSNTLTRLCLFE